MKLPDHADDIRAEGTHHRADRQDKEQRIFRHVPDVAEIALRVLLRELAVKAREHDRADAVEHARRERGEELVGIVERAHRAVVEGGGGRRVDEVAEEEDRRCKHRDERGLKVSADVVRLAVEHRAVEIALLSGVGDAHGELQKPRARGSDDDALDAPLRPQCHEENRQKRIVRDAHAALQFVVVGRLEDGDIQIGRRHDRQRTGHDADILRKARQLRSVKIPDRADKRRGGKELPQADRRKRGKQRDGHQIVGSAHAALAVGGKFLRQDRHRRDAQCVAHRRKEVER